MGKGALMTQHRVVTIIQQKDGWLNATYNRKYRTAFGALNAVKRDDRRRSKNGTVITTIEWRPNTRWGELAVRSLSE